MDAARATALWFSLSAGLLPFALPVAAEPAATAESTTTLKPIVITGRAFNPPNERPQLDVPAVTGSRLGLTPRETPASITIIDRATIEKRGDHTTQQSLERAPGVLVSDQPGSAGSVCMRGFCGSQITQLFNGLTVQYDVVAARPIDNWLTDRIEVLGGPSTFLYGQGAVGGSINYVSKTANRERQGHDALLLLGSFLNRRVAYGYGGRVGQSDNWVQVDAAYKGSQGFVDETEHDSGVFSASLLSDLTARLSHTIAIEYQREDREAYWGTPLLNPVTAGRFDERTRFLNFNARDSVFDQQVLWVRDVLEYRLAERTRITNTAYYYDASRQWRNVEMYRWNAANTRIDRRASFATDHEQFMVGNRLELAHEGAVWRFPSLWSAGVDVTFNQQTRSPSLESGLPVDTIDPFNFTPGTYFDFARATGPIADRRNTLMTTALFAENRLTLRDGLNFVSGIRFDDIELDSDNLRAGTPLAHPQERSFKREWQPLTWRLGLMYDIAPDFNLYAQYSTAADPPAGILTTTNFRNIRDFGLTTGRQFEIGSKFDFWQNRGSATVAGFYLERQNLVTRDPNDPLLALPIGAQSSRGVEANAGLRITPEWSVQGNMAWVDATFDEFNENVRIAGRDVAVSRAGNRPANVAEWVANTWLTWHFHPQAEWMFATRYVGERFADPANTVPVAAYARFDTQLSWQASRNANLTLRVLNLTDDAYIEWADPTPMYLLGAPRTFEVAAWLKF